MGLAVVVVVIVGVMGAGLLVFVRNDLEAVVEVNQGQRAFETADAGVQAAQQRLNSGESIDGTQWSSGSSNDADECKDLGPDGDPNGVCLTGLYDTPTDIKNAANVQIESTGGNEFTVTSTGKYGNAKRRVEATFKKTGGSGSGEGEFPQMVYAAQNAATDRLSLDGVSMYSESDIINKNGLTMNDASLFSGGDIELNIQNAANFIVSSDGSSIEQNQNNCDKSSSEFEVEGTDPYGDWEDGTYNSTPRNVDASGIGAVEKIKGQNNSRRKPCGWGTQFFDSDTGDFSGSNPQANFLAETSDPQEDDEITFPFGTTPDVDALANDLKETAKSQPKQYTVALGGSNIDQGESQGNYIKISSGNNKNVGVCDASGGGCDVGDVQIQWPTVDDDTPASEWPVVYVEFASSSQNNTLYYQIRPEGLQYSGDTPSERCAGAREDYLRRGILAVDKGTVTARDRTAPLDGGIVTIGNPSDRRDIRGSAPDLCIRGAVITSGSIDRDSNYTSFGALDDEDAEQLPVFDGGGSSGPLTSTSWRELYQ
jgi:type II secretory pathway pseudopilin PulG